MPHFQQGFTQQQGAVANATQLFDIGQKIFIQCDCGSHRILQVLMNASNIAPNDAYHDASPSDLPMTRRWMSDAPS